MYLEKLWQLVKDQKTYDEDKVTEASGLIHDCRLRRGDYARSAYRNLLGRT